MQIGKHARTHAYTRTHAVLNWYTSLFYPWYSKVRLLPKQRISSTYTHQLNVREFV